MTCALPAPGTIRTAGRVAPTNGLGTGRRAAPTSDLRFGGRAGARCVGWHRRDRDPDHGRVVQSCRIPRCTRVAPAPCVAGDLVGNVFAPARIDRYRPAVERLTSRLLDALVQAGDPVEVNEQLALPLTLGVIGGAMGLPDDDLTLFRAWGDMFLSTGADRAAENERAMLEMSAYMAGRLGGLMVDAEPRRPEEGGLLSVIAGNAVRPRTSLEETALLAAGLVIAGWETTAAAIAGLPVPAAHHQKRRRRDSLPASRGTSPPHSPCSRGAAAHHSRHRLRIRAAAPGRTCGGTRRRSTAGGRPGDSGDRPRQPRPGRVRGTRARRLPAHPELPPRLRKRPPCLPGRPAGPAGAGRRPAGATRRFPDTRLHHAPHDVVWNTVTSIRHPAALWLDLASSERAR